MRLSTCILIAGRRVCKESPHTAWYFLTLFGASEAPMPLSIRAPLFLLYNSTRSLLCCCCSLVAKETVCGALQRLSAVARSAGYAQRRPRWLCSFVVASRQSDVVGQVRRNFVDRYERHGADETVVVTASKMTRTVSVALAHSHILCLDIRAIHMLSFRDPRLVTGHNSGRIVQSQKRSASIQEGH